MKIAVRALTAGVVAVAVLIIAGCQQDNNDVADLDGTAPPTLPNGAAPPRNEAQYKQYYMKNQRESLPSSYPGAGGGPPGQ